MIFQEINADQAREYSNTRQRYQALVDARQEFGRYKGSMSFGSVKGSDYLMRSYYDKNGTRKFRSLGPRSVETEKLKIEFDAGKKDAEQRVADARASLERQAAINKAIGLGRVPRLNARILRQLEASQLMDSGARLVGTNCIFAYEAAAGVRVQSELTTTDDVDILMDARANLRLVVDEEQTAASLMSLLNRVDRSFRRTPRTFQAANRDGFLVDLVKPVPHHPGKPEPTSVSPEPDDLVAAEIEGLVWHVNSPVFVGLAIDIDGLPVRIVAPDPVAFAVHKLWLSQRADREPFKKGRDSQQARSVAQIVARYLPHYAFDPARLKQFPKKLVEDAAELFRVESTRAPEW